MWARHNLRLLRYLNTTLNIRQHETQTGHDTLRSHYSGGGLEPAAANTGLWDLVPPPPVHRQTTARRVRRKALFAKPRLYARFESPTPVDSAILIAQLGPGLREGQRASVNREATIESLRESGTRRLRRPQGKVMQICEPPFGGSPKLTGCPVLVSFRASSVSARDDDAADAKTKAHSSSKHIEFSSTRKMPIDVDVRQSPPLEALLA